MRDHDRSVSDPVSRHPVPEPAGGRDAAAGASRWRIDTPLRTSLDFRLIWGS
ncbi:hypothetical protein BH20ACT6_BH20ACT6_14070 [soil metagenome]